jgi:hypothetical protein
MSPTRTQHLYEVTLDWGYETEVIKGWGSNRTEAAADAMNSAGYGGGAMLALKSWEAKKVEGEKE